MEESVRTAPTAAQIEGRILSALSARDALAALRAEAKALLTEGVGKEALLAVLQNCVMRMRAANRENDEDVLLDVMDLLTGWCAPSAKIGS